MSDSPVFEVSRLSFRYEHALAVSCEALRVSAGEVVAFVGPNGSGKTTMLKLLNGILGPYQGTIAFMGLPLKRNPHLRRRSVYLHQHPVLFTGTVRDNLEYAQRLKHMRRDEATIRLERTAERFGIEALLERDAGALSGGETQRVAIARAVAAGADVLLLDEPTSSLDAESDAAMRTLLLDLKRDGATILFSAHDPELVHLIADRIIYFTPSKEIHHDSPR
ncbi:MAG TPA: ABC transporter ATP-binding protein [bacterium]|nr:ABC transporter ATP-binding protein [bacterium]